MFTFRLINEAEIAQQINEIVRVTGREGGEVIRQESKLLVQDLVRLTPPFGPAPSTESYGKQREVGEHAVERDVRNVFTVLDLDKIRNEGIRERLRLLMRKGDLDGVKGVLKGCKIPVNTVLLEADAGVHEFARDRRGRVQTWKKIYVIRERGVNRYVREMKSHVGRSKAGWAAAAAALGVRLPSWITRHGTSGGSVRDQTRGNEPKVTIVNEHGGGGSDLRVVDRAMKNRIRNIKAKLEKIVRSGWKKK